MICVQPAMQGDVRHAHSMMILVYIPLNFIPRRVIVSKFSVFRSLDLGPKIPAVQERIHENTNNLRRGHVRSELGGGDGTRPRDLLCVRIFGRYRVRYIDPLRFSHSRLSSQPAPTFLGTTPSNQMQLTPFPNKLYKLNICGI